MDAGEVGHLFTRGDGSFLCARWGRPIVPVVFGVDDATLRVVKGAVEAVVALAGHEMSETDPELGANLMLFFVRDWDELRGVPNLDRLIDGLGPLLDRLEAAEANQYRVFRFDQNGAIRACFVFLRMDEHLSAVPAEILALSQAVQSILLWSDRAFVGTSPLGLVGEVAVLKPQIAGVIRAAYDRALPVMAQDPSHALRLLARIGAIN
ncbi:MAG: hypothetical protein U0934_05445 [Pseudotabrizicola sp.]|uniref:hypothetical protein n=1 Tax=Pseudotabrizicola sp. TaxID=2939647 RepID=UPI002731A94D|nr:hypothetical protein [Pseudotabrizicola sp.]MDP2080655.1 hypothetical protein [Pseudotabrizicola sp.]MDZ7573384.1 hypothetical protein [Pseudotabrizicola sp.]